MSDKRQYPIFDKRENPRLYVVEAYQGGGQWSQIAAEARYKAALEAAAWSKKPLCRIIRGAAPAQYIAGGGGVDVDCLLAHLLTMPARELRKSIDQMREAVSAAEAVMQDEIAAARQQAEAEALAEAEAAAAAQLAATAAVLEGLNERESAELQQPADAVGTLLDAGELAAAAHLEGVDISAVAAAGTLEGAQEAIQALALAAGLDIDEAAQQAALTRQYFQAEAARVNRETQELEGLDEHDDEADETETDGADSSV